MHVLVATVHESGQSARRHEEHGMMTLLLLSMKIFAFAVVAVAEVAGHQQVHHSTCIYALCRSKLGNMKTLHNL